MSKFDKIFEAREVDAEDLVAVGDSKSNGKEDVKSGIAKKKIVRSKSLVEEFSDANVSTLNSRPVNLIRSGTQTPTTKRGRPPAKRSDPDFVGLTTYIRRETHLNAKISLLQEGENRELSELVEDLIAAWLSKQ